MERKVGSTMNGGKELLVSIITVCYNSEATIRDTINSVLNQTYSDLEYIIIDGSSTDDTVTIIKEYENIFREKKIAYRYLSEPDKGIYDAMNKGIRMASGELIGIINSDDWYEPEAVETAVVCYSRENYDLFYADLRVIGEKRNFIKKAKNSKWVTSRYWNHPTTFIPAKVYQKYQYKTENIHDDWDLILRIRKDGARICVKSTVLANFRMVGISHKKGFKRVLERAGVKYKIYRDNGYSRLYFIECYGMEFAKMVL